MTGDGSGARAELRWARRLAAVATCARCLGRLGGGEGRGRRGGGRARDVIEAVLDAAVRLLEARAAVLWRRVGDRLYQRGRRPLTAAAVGRLVRVVQRGSRRRTAGGRIAVAPICAGRRPAGWLAVEFDGPVDPADAETVAALAYLAGAALRIRPGP